MLVYIFVLPLIDGKLLEGRKLDFFNLSISMTEYNALYIMRYLINLSANKLGKVF